MVFYFGEIEFLIGQIAQYFDLVPRHGGYYSIAFALRCVLDDKLIQACGKSQIQNSGRVIALRTKSMRRAFGLKKI
jgi:hypothetical protein